jgi:hypothetical protein
MNSYQYALQKQITGTEYQIVSQLAESGVTARPIHLNELLYLLNMRGMLVKLAVPGEAGERWTGTIMNMIAAINAVGTDIQKLALSIWFSHITNPRNANWDTTQPAHAATFLQLAQTFGGQAGMPTVADFTAVAALGGGWLFSGLTVDGYIADKLAYETAEVERIAAEEAEQAARINQARKSQMYSALLDASRWLESQEQCPTQAELLDYLTPNLPGEE